MQNQDRTIELDHTISVDIDAIEGFKENDIKFLMGGSLCNHNEVEYELTSTIFITAEEVMTADHPGCPQNIECEDIIEDVAFRLALKEVTGCCPVRRLRIFPLLADAIVVSYQRWIDKEMYDAANKVIEP